MIVYLHSLDYQPGGNPHWSAVSCGLGVHMANIGSHLLIQSPGFSSLLPAHLRPSESRLICHSPLPFHQGSCERKRLVSRMPAAPVRVGGLWVCVALRALLAKRQLWELCAHGLRGKNSLFWKPSLATCLYYLTGVLWDLMIGCTVGCSRVFQCDFCIIYVAVPCC